MTSIVVDKPGWQAPDNVRAFTTTVSGGISRGVFSSLNLGDHVGDDSELVLQNRALIREDQSLPVEPIWLNQVHSTDVVELTSRSGGLIPTADGSFTREAGVVCAIMTADCLPLFLTNSAGDRVALLHAGWRGLADGIVEAGVRALDCPVDEIIAWAGPCIGPNAFEVGDEVRQQLGGSDGAYKKSPNSSVNNLKWLANMYLLTEERLTSVGVNNYSHSASCTYSDERYFSYRRSGQCGRMASFIWINE